MAKSKRKRKPKQDEQPGSIVPPPDEGQWPPPLLPVVEQPESGKREVTLDPPVRVRLLANSAEGLVISAERSAATVNAGEVTDRQLDSASRDQTMYVVALGSVGAETRGTYAASALEVL